MWGVGPWFSFDLLLHLSAEIDVTPGPGHFASDGVRYGVISGQRNVRAATIVGKERYTPRNPAPPPSKYAVPYTFGTGSVDKTGGRSWTIGVRRGGVCVCVCVRVCV